MIVHIQINQKIILSSNENLPGLSPKNHVRMILVGGGAVNFHGYQRHSADVDFWIDLTELNLLRLVNALHDLGYSIKELPQEVKDGKQNISIRISPVIEI